MVDNDFNGLMVDKMIIKLNFLEKYATTHSESIDYEFTLLKSCL